MTKILKATEENLRCLAEKLRQGEIIAFPTETVYGLGTNCFNEEACRKIFAIKNRPLDKPLSVLVENFEQIFSVAEKISELEKFLIERFFPGSLTLILPKKNSLPSIVTAKENFVGVRMPNCAVTLQLIRLAGVPLIGTSANTSGKPSPKNSQEVLDDLQEKIKFILDGECSFGMASTVVKCEAEQIKILRQGQITQNELEIAKEDFFRRRKIL